ncbi:MAG: hypothetical protein ACR2PZ_10035 [Pseudomonadales bacterium]
MNTKPTARAEFGTKPRRDEGGVAFVHLGVEGGCPRASRLHRSIGEASAVQLICEDSQHVWVEVRASGLFGKAWNLLLILFGHFERYVHSKYCLHEARPLVAKQVICHDLLLLPLAIQRWGGGNVIFDAREYYPRQFEHNRAWRIVAGRLNQYLCSTYLPKVAQTITVSQGLAQLYEREYRVPVSVAPSFSEYLELSVGPVGDPVRLVHHGNATPNRQLENMVLAMDLLGGDYVLDLYLVWKEDRYRRRLEHLCAQRDNVNLCKPVHFEQIVPTLNGYDIGLFVPPAATVNLDLALPNKLFEYVQARLMIVVSPLQEASRLVREHDLGTVAASAAAQDIASCIKAVARPAVLRYKRNAQVAAKILCADAFVEVVCKHLVQVQELSDARVDAPEPG